MLCQHARTRSLPACRTHHPARLPHHGRTPTPSSFPTPAGSQSLPINSQVVFVNTHAPEPSLSAALRGICLSRIGVSHIQADPLKRSQLATLDVASFK